LVNCWQMSGTRKKGQRKRRRKMRRNRLLTDTCPREKTSASSGTTYLSLQNLKQEKSTKRVDKG
jgi:hypothetical protein